MAYDYFRTAASPEAPTYKGKALKPAGKDTWVLENGVLSITCHYKAPGWKASLKWKNGRPSLPGETFGRDLEEVIDGMIKNEYARLAGARQQLAEAQKALDSLG